MVTLCKAGRIAAAATCSLGVLAAPAMAGGHGGRGGGHAGGMHGGGVHGGGSTPLPGSAGSKPMEDLNQPNFEMDAPSSRFPFKPGVTPHWPRLVPRAGEGATGQ